MLQRVHLAVWLFCVYGYEDFYFIEQSPDSINPIHECHLQNTSGPLLYILSTNLFPLLYSAFICLLLTNCLYTH
jgi:hypothetical protein